jgi:dTDP-4-dehydrorhamnose reductase
VVGTPEREDHPVTKILVIGAGGMLGTDVMRTLSSFEPRGMTHADLDIREAPDVEAAIEGFDVVVNTAAYTRVDDAESHSELAFAINARGAGNIARAAHMANARLIHVSTDYVFEGNACVPYAEDAPTKPLSVYGASKLAGDNAVQEQHGALSSILRTSWLYGEHGSSFPRTMLRLGQENPTVSVVEDQIGQPTWTMDVAHMIRNLIESSIPSGMFHATNSGHTSWFRFAQRLFERAGWDPGRVIATQSVLFPRPAPRPSWSVLDHAHWQHASLPLPRSWESAFDDAWASFIHQWTRGS